MFDSFDLNKLLVTILNVLIIPILPVIAAFIIAFLKKKTAELESSIKNHEVDEKMGIIESAIMSSVAAVNQAYIDSIKKTNGYLTPDELNTAVSLVKEKLMNIIGDAGLKALSELFADVNTWLENRIIYYINKPVK